MRNLTDKDYKTILTYYKVAVPKNKQKTRKLAEKLIVTKLCRCIKKVDKRAFSRSRQNKTNKTKRNRNRRNQNEGRAIGVCTNAVINRKGFTRGNFECKKNATIQLYKK